MNPDVAQNIRYKLQQRRSRLNNHDVTVFHNNLKQFYSFLHQNQIISGILEELAVMHPISDEIIKKIANGDWSPMDLSEEEYAATCYFLIKACVSDASSKVEAIIGLKLTRDNHFSECLAYFVKTFVDPLYEYIDEKIDENSFILTILMKYKHKCEWFQRNGLYDIWKSNSQIGERTLARHLYEYLFDNGIEFAIEPESASGEIDLISSQIGDDRLIADAKIFNPEKGEGKTYIIKAFHQIYTYTNDYNEISGFLVIFNTSNVHLELSFNNKGSIIPYVIYNQKVIFFVVIEIFPYTTSASKRGKLESIELKEEELISNFSTDLPR